MKKVEKKEKLKTALDSTRSIINWDLIVDHPFSLNDRSTNTEQETISLVDPSHLIIA